MTSTVIVVGQRMIGWTIRIVLFDMMSPDWLPTLYLKEGNETVLKILENVVSYDRAKHREKEKH